jgi:hypothetical protein
MAEAIDDLPGGDRRSGEDRRESPGGRRAEDQGMTRGQTAWAAGWAIIAGIIVLFLFLTVIGSVNPDKAPVASVIVLILAIAWLAHAWQRVLAGGHVSRPDRERRGF